MQRSCTSLHCLSRLFCTSISLVRIRFVLCCCGCQGCQQLQPPDWVAQSLTHDPHRLGSLFHLGYSTVRDLWKRPCTTCTQTLYRDLLQRSGPERNREDESLSRDLIWDLLQRACKKILYSHLLRRSCQEISQKDLVQRSFAAILPKDLIDLKDLIETL